MSDGEQGRGTSASFWALHGDITTNTELVPEPIAEYHRAEEAKLSGIRWTGEVVAAGCGRGREVRVLGASASSVVAIDIAEEAVVAAQRALSCLPNVRFVVGDFCKTGFATASFGGVVFAFNVIGNLPPEDAHRALSEAHRLLAVGGLVVLTTYADNAAARAAQLQLYEYAAARSEVWRVAGETERGFYTSSGFSSRRFRRDELAVLLRSAGFAEAEVLVEPLTQISYLAVARRGRRAGG